MPNRKWHLWLWVPVTGSCLIHFVGSRNPLPCLDTFVLCVCIVCVHCLGMYYVFILPQYAHPSPSGNQSLNKLQPQLLEQWFAAGVQPLSCWGVPQHSCTRCWRQLSWQLLSQITCSLLAEGSYCSFCHLHTVSQACFLLITSQLWSRLLHLQAIWLCAVAEAVLFRNVFILIGKMNCFFSADHNANFQLIKFQIWNLQCPHTMTCMLY